MNTPIDPRPVSHARIGVRFVVAALALAALLPLGTSAAVAAQAEVAGIDVSHWQGAVRWDEVQAAGVRFAIAKATDGATFVDERYVANRDGADAVGVLFTAYHFARPDAAAGDAILEADHFVDTAGLRGRHLLPVLDLEDAGGLGPRKLRRWVRAWLGRVQERLDVKPIIYASPSFWRDKMGNSAWFANHGYRLWIAHWYADQPSVPASNWAGRGWTLWQHDDCGSVAGVDGCVDLDRHNGTAIGALRIRRNR